jgi:hypothetical protein
MIRPLLIGLAAGTAAWLIVRNNGLSSSAVNKAVVPVQEAAANLQQAWADHHTTV